MATKTPEATQRAYILRHLTKQLPYVTGDVRKFIVDLKTWIKGERKRTKKPGGIGK